VTKLFHKSGNKIARGEINQHAAGNGLNAYGRMYATIKDIQT
jgi:hypothetical protein